MNNIKNKKSETRNFKGRKSFQQQGFKPKNTKKKVSSIKDPNILVKKAILKEEIAYTPSRSFNQMPINDKIKVNLAKKGFIEPTQIQDKTLEYLIS